VTFIKRLKEKGKHRSWISTIVVNKFHDLTEKSTTWVSEMAI
jgi:hypothetical protein